MAMTWNDIEERILTAYRTTPARPGKDDTKLKRIGAFLNGLDRLIPPFADYLSWRLFYTPHSPRVSDEERSFRAEAQHEKIVSVRGNQVAIYRWGEGPAIFMVHGWSSRSTRHAPIIRRFVETGYQVIAIDLPGHGLSEGFTTDQWELSRLVIALADRYGVAEAAIGHSFGGLAIVNAAKEKHIAEKIVTVAAPALVEGLIENYGRNLGLNRRLVGRIRERLATYMAFLGEDFLKRFSAFENPAALQGDYLLVHDTGDTAVLVMESQLLGEMMGNARTLITEGLGHNKILRHPPIIDEILAFIRNGASS